MSDERYTKIVFPIVNLNGNTKEDLIKELEELVNSIDQASDKLCSLTIHGRNYQLNPVDDFLHARNQQNRWIESINKIRKEAMNLYQNIYDQ